MAVMCGLVLGACGEYQRAQKSTDFNYKFDYAKRAFEDKKYVQAATLLKDCITVLLTCLCCKAPYRMIFIRPMGRMGKKIWGERFIRKCRI